MPGIKRRASTAVFSRTVHKVWICNKPSLVKGKRKFISRKETNNSIQFMEETIMAFFTSAVGTLQTLVVALGAGLGIWGAINLMEGYGNDNPGANAHVP